MWTSIRQRVLIPRSLFRLTVLSIVVGAGVSRVAAGAPVSWCRGRLSAGRAWVVGAGGLGYQAEALPTEFERVGPGPGVGMDRILRRAWVASFAGRCRIR